jgi:hypothetical protein
MKILSSRALKCAINLGHSVLMLVVLWVLMDLLQSSVRDPAKVFLTANKAQRSQVASVTTAMNSEIPEVQMHGYGYHAKQVRLNLDPPTVPKVAMVPVKHLTCPVPSKVVLAKAIPKPEKVTKIPEVIVKRVVPQWHDARGVQAVYARADL